MDAKWEWFCGINSSYTDESVDWYDDIRNNTCMVNGLATIPHVAFLFLSSLILLVLGCFTSYRRVHTKYLLVYPGHSLRWLVTVLLLVIILASIGEGIMTDETYQAWKQPTQPHLYIHSIVAFAAIILSLIYYHHMEVWQLPAMSVLLLIYWVFSLCNEVIRILSLENQNQNDLKVLLFDLTIVKLAIYCLLIILETNVIRRTMCCFREDVEFPDDLKLPEMKCMQYNVSLFSSQSYWWLNWLLALGYKKHIELTDLGVVPERHQATFNHERFRKVFREETVKANKVGKEASLFKVYVKVYGPRMLTAGFLKVTGELFAFIGPVAVGTLTVYVETIASPSDKTVRAHNITIEEFFANGFVLVVVMFLAALVSTICLQTHYYISIIEGMNAGAALQSMVYEKSLRLSSVAVSSGKMNTGQIINHMSIDQDAVQYMFQYINIVCAVPIQLIVNVVLLYLTMGYSAVIGASVFLVMTPVQAIIASYMGKHQKNRMGCSDKRLEKTNELLQGIKLLKLYSWEGLYCKAIEVIRAKELGFLYRINVGYVSTLALTLSSPVFVTVLGFGTYTALTGNPLTPDVTFSALSLFNMLFLPLINLPTCLLHVINGIVSTYRLQTFLAAPDIADGIDDEDLGQGGSGRPMRAAFTDDHWSMSGSNVDEYDEIQSAYTVKSPLISANVDNSHQEKVIRNLRRNFTKPMPKAFAVKVSHGSFQWDPASDLLILSGINVEIPKGKLTIVIGQVGSGKSSLLSAILGEMTTVSGTVQIRNGYQIALAAQKPWLMNNSLQENILFSQPLDAKRYKRVIDACALRPDIENLPAGDQTEIGEKGINLSGGQKQRVSVARAMYSGRELIILDDPLSALDVHVGSHLFTEGIIKVCLSERQTVVLVTHQLQYLNHAHLIIKMEDGRITAQGTLDDIIATYPDIYSEYDRAVRQATESSADIDMESSGQESEGMKEDRLFLQKQVKMVEHRPAGSKQANHGADTSGSLMEKEEMERGSVSYQVYQYYARNFGLGVMLLAATLCGLYAGLNIGANFWLSDWAESGLRNITEAESQLDEFFGGFVGFEMGYLLCRLVAFAITVWGIVRAARRLHQRMLRNIIKVPLRFFDTVPTGRILNRFSNDTGLIDVKMTQNILVVISSFLNTMSAVIVNTIVMPVFIIFFVPVAIGFFFLQKYFLASSRELQRLNSTSKSPVLAFFSESLSGVTTIRAYKASGRFYNTLIERVNRNLTVFLFLQTVIRWVCIRLDFLGAITILIAGMATLVGAFTIGLTPSLVGLAVSYTLQVSQNLNSMTRIMAEVEMQMNGVERVKYYTGVDNEHYQGEEPPSDWPQNGNIQMEHVSVRYAHGTDTVLNDVTIDIKAGQKVGICGRTGAGKSSLTLALLRVIDIFQGRILIDGVDIKSVPLTTLRSQLSIIPQDPVLFAGTLRHNLDPVSTSENSDEDIWHALEISQLKSVVSSFDDGLEFMVTEGGENFSVGQRQLFCLARAFLRKSRILIMDEATASMDIETDKVLQKVVETAFAERTVLIIAHRITTILNSDVILVLDEGKLAEYGTPDELLEHQDGIFASFVRNKDM